MAGGTAAAGGKEVAKPVAKRTLSALETDISKTGMRDLPRHLPTDFPRGPWLVDDAEKNAYAQDGWATQEKKWLNDMQVYASSTTTPSTEPDCTGLKWRMDSFTLS